MQPAEEAAQLAITLAGPQRLALGTMALAGVYGRVPAEVAKQTIRTAQDAGITMFDTAPLYGNGTAEELLGAELAGNDTVIVTKFGLEAGRDGKLIKNSQPASIRLSVESSLRRLRRDRIDVLLQHRADPTVDEADIADVLQQLVREGKVAHVGLSHCNVSSAIRISAKAPIRVIQNELSAASDIPPGENASDFANAGLLLMAHSPLARGLLAQAQPRAFQRGDYRSTMESFDQPGQKALLDRAASRLSVYGSLSAPVSAIRWVLDQGANVIAVIGSRSPGQVASLLQG